MSPPAKTETLDRDAVQAASGLDFDIAANRATIKWSLSELAFRLLWELARGPLFRMSPRRLWAWRRFLLRTFGARVSRHVHIYPTVKVAVPWNLDIGDFASIGDGAVIYSLGHISIAEHATVSQYAHLCAGTHDHEDVRMTLVEAPIQIGRGAWICADAFVGPGVSVGQHVIVGARAVVMADVPEAMITVGNPARVLRPRKPFKT